MKAHAIENLVTFRDDCPIWERVFTVNPLVLIGTQERDGGYNLAPKHMAFPMGWENYFGFVCTPRHVDLPQRQTGGSLHGQLPPTYAGGAGEPCRLPARGRRRQARLDALPTFPASEVDGVFIRDALPVPGVRSRQDRRRFRGEQPRSRAASWRRTSIGTTFASSERDDQDLIHDSPLLAYLSPGRYASIGENNSFPFPAGLHAVGGMNAAHRVLRTSPRTPAGAGWVPGTSRARGVSLDRSAGPGRGAGHPL